MKKYDTPEISIVKIQNEDCVMLSSLGATDVAGLDVVKYSDIN